jgi:hypothetical protein
MLPPSWREKGSAIRINKRSHMRQPVLNPTIADFAPSDPTLTAYDEEHLLVYLRLLDAEADGADWMEASLTVLRIDPIREPARAQHAWQSHLVRAKWITERGYLKLLCPEPHTGTLSLN